MRHKKKPSIGNCVGLCLQVSKSQVATGPSHKEWLQFTKFLPRSHPALPQGSSVALDSQSFDAVWLLFFTKSFC